MVTVLPSSAAYFTFAAILGCVFLLIAVVFYFFGQRSVLGYPAVWGLCGGIFVLGLLLSVALKGWVKVEGEVLTVYAPFSKASFNLDDLRLSDLMYRNSNSEPKLVLRMLGVGLPSFKSGIFGTSERETVIVLLSEGAGVYIPGRSSDGKFDGLIVDKHAFDSIVHLMQSESKEV